MIILKSYVNQNKKIVLNAKKKGNISIDIN